jgi:SAM-dependent methyltransferase
LRAVGDNSLDVITLTNVLHHLKSPIDFLNGAAAKLKPGGKVIATEPYFSVLSSFIFKYLHHEAVDFRISRPELDEVEGPLASANIALPWLIFCRRRDWLRRLNANYQIHMFSIRPFTALSYMITGGIARKFPIPALFYRAMFPIDLALSRCFPRLCASFFTLTLTRR